MADRQFIIDIILNAHDRTAAALASATTKLEAFEELNKRQARQNDELANSYRRMSGNIAQSERTLEESRRKLGAANDDTLEKQVKLEKAARDYVATVGKQNTTDSQRVLALQKMVSAERDLAHAIEDSNKHRKEQINGRDHAERIRQAQVEIEQVNQLAEVQEKAARERLKTIEETYNKERQDAIQRQRALDEDARRDQARYDEERRAFIERQRAIDENYKRDRDAAVTHQRALDEDLRRTQTRYSEERQAIIAHQRALDEDVRRAETRYNQERQAAITHQRAIDEDNKQALNRERNFQRQLAETVRTERRSNQIAGRAGVPEEIRKKVDIDADDAHAKLLLLGEEIRRLDGKEIDVKVELHAARFLAEAELMRAEMRHLQSETNNTTGGFGGLRAAITAAAHEFNDNNQSIAAFDNLLRGLLTLGITVFFQQLFQVVGAVAGALTALASSAIEAGGALAGGLVAGIAQAIPALGLLGTVLTRLTGVFNAVKQANLLQQQQSYQGQKAANREASAAERVKNAQETLAEAHRRVADAQRGLTQAREDARRKLEDLVLAEREAELAAKGAVLSQRDAQKALEQAIATGGDVAGRQLAVEESNLNIDRTQQGLSRAQSDAGTARAQGVEGSDQVRKAKEQIDNANRSVDAAVRGLARAQRQSDIASANITAAAGKLNFLLSQMSDAERRLYEALITLQQRFHHVARVVSEPLINAFTVAAGRIYNIFGDKRLVNVFRDLSQEAAKQFTRIFSAFTSGDALRQFTRLTASLKANLEPVATAAINFGKAFLNIGEIASPALHRILEWISDISKKFLDFTRTDTHDISTFFDNGVTALQSWANLLFSIVRLFLAITGPGGGAESGVKTLDAMTAGINHAADEINRAGSSANRFFNRFFELSRKMLAETMPIFRALGQQIARSFNNDGVASVRGFATIMSTVLIPALGNFIRFVGRVTQLTGAFLQAVPAVGKLTAAVIGLSLSFGLFLKVKTLFGPLVALVKGLDTQFGIVTKTVSKFRGVVDEALIRGTSEIGLTTRSIYLMYAAWALIPAIIILLLAKLHLLDDVWRALKSGFDAFMKPLRPAFDHLRDALQHLSDAFSKAFGQGSAGRPIMQALISIVKALSVALGGTLGNALALVVDVLAEAIDLIAKISGAFHGFGGVVLLAAAAFYGRAGIISGLRSALVGIRALIAELPLLGRAFKTTAAESAVAGETIAASTAAERSAGFGSFLGSGAIPAAEKTAARGGILSRAGSFLKTKGGLLAIGGAIGGQVIGSAVGGSAGHTISNIGTGAALGATIGSVVPILGTGVGAVAGGVIGGALSLFGNHANKAREAISKFTEQSQKKLQEFAKSGNAKGFRQLQEAAEGMAKRFPEARDQLNKIAEAASQGAKKFGPLEAVMKRLRNAKIQVDTKDLIDVHESKNAINQFLSNMTRLRNGGVTSIKDLRDNMKFNMDEINKGAVQGSKTWTTLMSRNFSGGIDLVKKALKDGVITNDEAMKEIARITGQEMTFAKNNMSNLSAEASSTLASNFSAAAEAAGLEGGRIGDLTEKALKRIRKLLEQEFAAFGLSPDQARTLAKNRTTKGRENINQFGQRDEGAAATGGYYGMPGERGHDAGLFRLGRGEAVLNWAHQKVVNSALWQQYGTTLEEMFKHRRARHAGPGGLLPSAELATGGYALSGVHEGVRRAALRILDKYPSLSVTSTTGGGHAKNSYHYRGEAVDLGGPAEVMNKAAGFIRSVMGKNLTEGIHDPNLSIKNGQSVPASFWGSAVWTQHLNHIHIAVAGALGKIAGLAGAMVKQIKAPRIKGGGQLGLLAQLGVNAATKAANQKLQEAAEASGGDPMAEKVAGGLSRAQVGQVVNRAMEILNVPQTLRGAWRSMAVARAWQESTGNPNSINNWDKNAREGHPSQGLFQTTPGTFSANMEPGYPNILGPLDNTLAAFKYMLARYGHGNWHAALQAMLGRAGVGYATGGIIPGADGQPTPILAHAGEWILNRFQQSRLANMLGTGVGRLKAAMGFTGGPTSFQGGGEVVATAASRSVQTHLERVLARIHSEQTRHEETLARLKKGHHDAEIKDENKLHDTRMKNLNAEEKKARGSLTLQEQRNVSIRSGVYTLPTTAPTDIAGVQRETSRVHKAIRNLHKISGDTALGKFIDNIDAISGENGLIDQFNTALDKLTNRTSIDIRLARRGFQRIRQRLSSGRIRDVLVPRVGGAITEGQAADRELDAAKSLTPILRHERSETAGDLSKVETQIRRIQRGGVTEKEKARFQQLVGQRNKLLATIDDLDGKIADNLDDVYDKTTAKIEADTADALKPGQKLQAAGEFAGRMADILGLGAGAKNSALELINQGLNKQLEAYRAAADEARRQGRTDLADQYEQEASDTLLTIAENIHQELQNQLDDLETASSRALNLIKRRQSIAARLGQPLEGFDSQIATNLNDKIANYRGLLQKAIEQGDFGAAADIQDRIDNAVLDLQELPIDIFERRVQDVTDAAQRAANRVGRMNRLADVAERAGASPTAVGQMRADALNESNASLIFERTQLEGLRNEASGLGNIKAFNDLTDQIEELDTQIAENTQALKDNAVAVRQAQIDLITGRGSFQSGVFGSLNQLVTTLGNITGSVNTDQFRSTLQHQGDILLDTGNKLRQQLAQAFGTNLLDKHGSSLIDAVSGLNFDTIEASFTPAQRQQFESLISAILDNENALQSNTQSIEELNGFINPAQSFSSSAWQQFRSAIFNGMGGLLNQYQALLPHMAEGGWINFDGPYYLHAGEYVAPKSVMEKGPQGQPQHIDESISITVNESDGSIDPDWLASRLAFARSHRR